MTRVHKTVFWTLAVCLFGYIAVHVLIVEAPGVAQARQPATDPARALPLPEDDATGLGEERAAPAPALQPARALVAICVDKGKPLEDVIVDVFRETPGESVFDPRVENFGRTKTKDDGKFSVTLPPIRGKTKGIEAAAKYILYFTAPGRPVKSLIVDNDTELPKEIFIPNESTGEVYIPTHHLVVVKPEGISVSPMLSAIRGFSKDGQPIRVAQLVDHRKEGKQRTANSESISAPGSAAKSTALVVYAIRNSTPAEVAKIIESQFAGRIEQVVQRNGNLLVRTDSETQAEIRGLVSYLDKAGRPVPASVGDGSKVAPHGYLGLVQQQQQATQERLRTARQALSDARTDDEKKVARAQLRQLLADVFVQDMQMREKQATEIEARLTKLRKQYQEREAAKDKIIDLQLNVIEADAAGLGFPGGASSRATPPSSISDPAYSFRNPKQVGSPTSDYPIRSGLPSRNLPPTRVDQHDPIPTERTLEEVKETDPAAVATLKERGHFIESKDGKLYAYANVNRPSGPSHIRVIDAATGKLVAAGVVNSVVGSLQFTDEGVETREADGKGQLRVPLKRRGGPNGEVFEFPSSSGNPFDPMTAALDPEFLKKYSTGSQTRVGELSARGHFVGSQDRKLYAYVETSGEGIPESTAEIRVCDVRTGQRLAAAKIKAPVGKLKFFNEGVATEDADGTLKLRISFSKDHDTQDVLETTGPAPTNNSVASLPGGSTPSPLSDTVFTAEYNALRNQYRKAKMPLALAETQFNALVAEAQKQKAETTIDDVKKQHPTAWRAVEQARPNFEAAHRLLETKLELLELDRKSATLALDTAKAKLEQMSELYKRNAATLSEVNQQRTAVDAAELNIERAERLMNLFKSISAEPTPTTNLQLPGPGSGGEASPRNETSSGSSLPPGNRVPALATSAVVSIREMLAFKPEGTGIDYEQPTDAEIDACRVVLEPGEAWTLLDRNLVLLRRFVDKNHDGVVDLWAYYKSGKEVWRDVDTDFDGKADHHVRVDSGSEAPSVGTAADFNSRKTDGP